MTIKKICDILISNDDYIISSHEAPDGDAIGAEIVLYSILKYLKKNVVILNSDPIENKYRYMDTENAVSHVPQDAPLPLNPDERTLLVVDTEPGNIGHLSSRLNDSTVRKVYVFDHHDYEKSLPFEGYFDSNASSTCEILHQVQQYFKIPYFAPLTEAMFSGIVYDTGSFIYPKTTARTFAIAHDLVLNGARPNFVYSNLYESKSTESLKLRTMVGSTLELVYNNHVAYQYMDKKTLDASGAKYEESQEIVNIPLQCSDVRVSIFIKQDKDGRTRCSIRTKNEIDCLPLASRFGGGGHPTAAGFKLTTAVEEVKSEVLDFFAPFFT